MRAACTRLWHTALAAADAEIKIFPEEGGRPDEKSGAMQEKFYEEMTDLHHDVREFTALYFHSHLGTRREKLAMMLVVEMVCTQPEFRNNQTLFAFLRDSPRLDAKPLLEDLAAKGLISPFAAGVVPIDYSETPATWTPFL